MFKKRLKKICLTALGLSLSLTPAIAFAQSADVQARLAALLLQLQQLQQQILLVQNTQSTQTVNTGLSGPSGIPCPNPQLTRSLSRGATGTDVAALQGFLINTGYLTGTNVTGYFGALTEAALQRFQAARGITSSGTPDTTGYGYVGPKTRQMIMQVCTGSASTSVNTIYVPPQQTPVQQPVIQIPVQNTVYTPLTAIPSRVTEGQQVTLKWNVQNATGCVLSQQPPGGASVTVNVNLQSSGTALVTPIRSMVFTIVCTSIGIQNLGTVQSVSVTVDPSPAYAPQLTLTMNPSAVAIGGSATLTWSSTNAASCNLTSSPALFSANTISGTHSGVFPIANTYTFTFTCTGNDGQISTKTATITVGAQATTAATTTTTTTPPASTMTVTSDKLIYDLGETVLVTWNNPGTTTVSDWITYAPQGTTWTANTFPSAQPKFITDGAHSWSKSLIPTAAGTFELLYYSNGGYTLVGRSVPFTVKPLVFLLSSDQLTYAPTSSIQVYWKNPFTPQAKDWLTIVPSGAHYTASTWPGVFSNGYTGGAQSGVKTITAPSTPGAYELVYYSNDTFTELMRSTSTITVSSSLTSCPVYMLPLCPAGQHNVVTTTSSDSNNCPIKTNACVAD